MTTHQADQLDPAASAHSSRARAARLANDIAAQFPHLPAGEAAAAIAGHIRQFWEPRMRAELTELLAEPGTGLTERARAAAELLAR